MAGGKSENESWLNYTIIQFFRQVFNAISCVQLLAANYKHVVFSLIHLLKYHILSAFHYALERP